MSYPAIFQMAASSAAVTALLGTSPTRFWPFGRAQQNQQRPYAVHQHIYGTPQNTLSCPADIDNVGIQVDAYGTEVTQARQVSEALRDAFEDAQGNIVALNGEDWEEDTGLYRVSFTVEFWPNR